MNSPKMIQSAAERTSRLSPFFLAASLVPRRVESGGPYGPEFLPAPNGPDGPAPADVASSFQFLVSSFQTRPHWPEWPSRPSVVSRETRRRHGGTKALRHEGRGARTGASLGPSLQCLAARSFGALACHLFVPPCLVVLLPRCLGALLPLALVPSSCHHHQSRPGTARRGVLRVPLKRLTRASRAPTKAKWSNS